MKQATTLIAIVMLAWFAAATAQETSRDFSGRWTTDPDPAATNQAARGQAAGARGGGRGDMGSGWGSPMTITQDAAKLTVEYAFFGRGDMQPPLKFVYALDGTETRNTVMMGRGMQVQMAKTTWDAGKLVITTIHTLADPASGKPVTTEVKQTLSLESPTSLVVETTRAGVMGGVASTTRTVYRKI